MVSRAFLVQIDQDAKVSASLRFFTAHVSVFLVTLFAVLPPVSSETTENHQDSPGRQRTRGTFPNPVEIV